MARPRLYHVIDGKKECSKCHVVKLLDEFGTNAKASDGRQAECRICHNKRSKPTYPRDETIVEKACQQCGATKAATEFYDSPYNKTGMRPECKTCTYIHNKAWEKANPDKHKAISNRAAKKARENDEKRPIIYAKT